MKASYTSHADLLDIIFENRNKAYGAYALRRQYPENLFKALFFGLSFAGVFIYFILYTQSNQMLSVPFTPMVDTVNVSPFQARENPLPPPELPSNTSHPQNTIKNVVPVIVPNDIPFEDSVPTVEVQAQNVIGHTTNINAGNNPEANNGDVQSDKTVKPATETVAPEIFDFRMVEEPASFPGGEKAFQRFLVNNLRDPRDIGEELGEVAKVQVKFVVNKDGRVDAFAVIRSGGEKFDGEVLRVLRKMPRWKPARQNNQQVAMFFILPVSFAVNEFE